VSRDTKLAVIIAAVTAILGVVVWYLHDKTFAVLQPAGPIAAQEKHLLLIAVSLMLLVVVPVFILLAAAVTHHSVIDNDLDECSPTRPDAPD
jgi:heme/copper-type cytochrome/quinol oxidase subunit 2